MSDVVADVSARDKVEEWKPPSEKIGDASTMNFKVDRRKDTFDSVAKSEQRKQEKNTPVSQKDK